MSLPEEGVTDSKMQEKIRNARIAIYQLRALGVFSHGLSPIKSLRLYEALIQPRWEYAMHITPWPDGITDAIQEMERTFSQKHFGPIASCRVERLKLLCRIIGPKHRGKYSLSKMLKRVNRRKKEIDSTPTEQRRQRDLYWITEDMAEIQWTILKKR